MRLKGLTQADIEKFANFDWDDSADEEEDANMDRIIEETLKNLDNRAENMQVGLIDQFITTEDLSENENVAQEVMEKIDLQSLKWRSAEFMESETSWKKLCINAVKNISQSTPSSPAPTSLAPSSPAPSSPAPSSPAPSTGSESKPYKRAYVTEPAKSLRFDGYNHWPKWGTRGRCRLCNTGFPSCKCRKCNVHLCSNPQKKFSVSYHT